MQKIRQIIIFLRSPLLILAVLFCVYVFMSNIIVSSIWVDFFQEDMKKAFGRQFVFVMTFFLLFIGATIAFFIKTVQVLSYFVDKKKESLKIPLIQLILIMFFTVFGWLFNRVRSFAPPILNNLKSSFEKTEIDTIRIAEWLDTLKLNGYILEFPSNGKKLDLRTSFRLLALNKAEATTMIPSDIHKMLEPYLGKTYLKLDKKNRLILEIYFGSTYANVGVIVGYGFNDRIESLSSDAAINLNEKSFIWFRMG